MATTVPEMGADDSTALQLLFRHSQLILEHAHGQFGGGQFKFSLSHFQPGAVALQPQPIALRESETLPGNFSSDWSAALIFRFGILQLLLRRTKFDVVSSQHLGAFQLNLCFRVRQDSPRHRRAAPAVLPT